MTITKYGICQGGGLSVPNRIEDILERDTDRPIKVTMILNKEELEKLLKLKKSLTNSNIHGIIITERTKRCKT